RCLVRSARQHRHPALVQVPPVEVLPGEVAVAELLAAGSWTGHYRTNTPLNKSWPVNALAPGQSESNTPASSISSKASSVPVSETPTVRLVTTLTSYPASAASKAVARTQ